jgi:hypothetical protein
MTIFGNNTKGQKMLDKIQPLSPQQVEVTEADGGDFYRVTFPRGKYDEIAFGGANIGATATYRIHQTKNPFVEALRELTGSLDIFDSSKDNQYHYGTVAFTIVL